MVHPLEVAASLHWFELYEQMKQIRVKFVMNYIYPSLIKVSLDYTLDRLQLGKSSQPHGTNMQSNNVVILF